MLNINGTTKYTAMKITTKMIFERVLWGLVIRSTIPAIGMNIIISTINHHE